MKKINRQNKYYAVFLSSITLFLYVFIGAVYAGTSIKTFDFGASGDNPTSRSHSRTFAPPEKVAIVVAVNYRTNGETPVALVMEIEDAAGKSLAAREVFAEKTAKRIVINISASENTIHGCERFWQVRVRSKSGEVPTARIFGDITFSFVDPTATAIDVEGQSISLAKGGQTTKSIGNADSLNHPGIIVVRASWLDSLVNLVLPLKFELVRPDGSIAKTLIGYGMNSNGNPRLNFSHNITVSEAKQNGVWKLRISNNTEHDIIEIKPNVSFTKKCFE